jgi:hypothetical protein
VAKKKKKQTKRKEGEKKRSGGGFLGSLLRPFPLILVSSVTRRFVQQKVVCKVRLRRPLAKRDGDRRFNLQKKKRKEMWN